MYFHQCDLSTNSHNAYHSNADHDIGPTDIQRIEIHGWDTVDVRVNDAAYGNTWIGWWECHDWGANGYCNHGHSHLNTSWAAVPENYWVTLSVMCEEVGHSVGLDHRGSASGSCMNDYDDSTLYHLDGHDWYEINRHY